MWPRKQLDIDWADFAFGLRSFVLPAPSRNIVPAGWFSAGESLVSLSVRTRLGFVSQRGGPSTGQRDHHVVGDDPRHAPHR